MLLVLWTQQGSLLFLINLIISPSLGKLNYSVKVSCQWTAMNCIPDLNIYCGECCHAKMMSKTMKISMHRFNFILKILSMLWFFWAPLSLKLKARALFLGIVESLSRVSPLNIRMSYCGLGDTLSYNVQQGFDRWKVSRHVIYRQIFPFTVNDSRCVCASLSELYGPFVPINDDPTNERKNTGWRVC